MKFTIQTSHIQAITRENRKEIIKTMNKEKYEVPVMEIVEFETEDVITTSGDLDEGEV